MSFMDSKQLKVKLSVLSNYPRHGYIPLHHGAVAFDTQNLMSDKTWAGDKQRVDGL